VNCSRLAGAALILSILSAGAANAGQLYVACSADKDGTYGVYTGVVVFDFEDGDPFNVAVDGDGGIRGDVEHNESFVAWMNRGDMFDPGGTTEYDVTFAFDVPTAGGCLVPYLTAYSDHSGSEKNTEGETLCWRQSVCHFSDWIDTDGSVVPGMSTGDYGCTDCISEAAFPDEGYQFDGWSGDVVSTSPTINVCMDGSDKDVTAHFSYVGTGSGPHEGPQYKDPADSGGSGGGGSSGGGSIPPGSTSTGNGYCTFPDGTVVPCG